MTCIMVIPYNQTSVQVLTFFVCRLQEFYYEFIIGIDKKNWMVGYYISCIVFSGLIQQVVQRSFTVEGSAAGSSLHIKYLGNGLCALVRNNFENIAGD